MGSVSWRLCGEKVDVVGVVVVVVGYLIHLLPRRMPTAHNGHKLSHNVETIEGGIVIILGPFYNIRGDVGVFFFSRRHNTFCRGALGVIL